MKKKIGLILLSLSFMMPLFSCDKGESDFVPETDLAKIFQKIKDNNFTVYFQLNSIYNHGLWTNQTFRYTPYALEEGTGVGIAQGESDVFRYNIVDDQVVASLPLYNPSNGVRYDSIFEYTYGMQDVDLAALPTVKDSDGWYTYEFGKSKVNDYAILPVFLRFNPNSQYPPESLKMRVVGANLELESVLLDYKWEDQPDAKDFAKVTVYNIGATENPIVKKYLDDGKTSKKPLDMRFFKLINPYLSSYNYTITGDATKVYSTFKYNSVTIKYTEKAQTVAMDGGYYGFVDANRYVSNFVKEKDKLKITSTPRIDESTYYTYLWGEKIMTSLADVSYDNLIGYIDEEHENSYILTDSQFLYILGYVCNFNISNNLYASSARIEILDDASHSFKVYFDLENRETYQNIGTYVVTFSDLNKTVIPEVDRYLARGEKPSTQKKDELIKVMNKFKQNNYSVDIGVGTYYFTENYRYFKSYTSELHDYGIIKVGEKVHEFDVVDGKVAIDEKTDLKMTFPSTGSYFLADNDLGFISTFHESDLYNFDNYYVASSCGEEYWKNDAISVPLFNYLMGNPPLTVVLPQGAGIMVQDGEDPYDQRVTFVTTYASPDGAQTGSSSFTFYNFGASNVDFIDEYLKTQTNS